MNSEEEKINDDNENEIHDGIHIHIHSEKITTFFKQHPQLNIETTLESCIDMMENIIQLTKIDENNTNSIESQHHHQKVLNKIHESISSLQQKHEKQFQSIEEIKNRFHQYSNTVSHELSSLMSGQRDCLIQNIRDTMKSNHVDMYKSIQESVNKSEQSLSQQMELNLRKDELPTTIRETFQTIQHQFHQDLIQYMNDSIIPPLSKLKSKLNSDDEDDDGNEYDGNEEHDQHTSDDMNEYRDKKQRRKPKYERVLETMEKNITDKYRSLDETMKIRMDSYFSNQQNTNQTIFSDIVSKMNEHHHVVEHMDQYLHAQMGSSTKGKQGEQRMEIILSDLFPSADIENTSGKTACGDFIVRRKETSCVLIDTKDYKTVIPKDEIDKIIRDMKQNNCHGILVSHHSGICNREDMEIGIDEHRIIVYLHQTQYNPDKIKIAFNVIDKLDKEMKSVCDVTSETYTIPKEILEQINKEYRLMAKDKETLIETLKKQQNENIKRIQQMHIVSLSHFLDTKFQNTKQTEFICPMCDKCFKNRQAIAGHTRFCKLKHKEDENNNENNNTNKDDDNNTNKDNDDSNNNSKSKSKSNSKQPLLKTNASIHHHSIISVATDKKNYA